MSEPITEEQLAAWERVHGECCLDRATGVDIVPALTAEVRRLREREAAAAKLIRAAEASAYHSTGYEGDIEKGCPWCEAHESVKHEAGCSAAAWLTEGAAHE